MMTQTMNYFIGLERTPHDDRDLHECPHCKNRYKKAISEKRGLFGRREVKLCPRCHREVSA